MVSPCFIFAGFFYVPGKALEKVFCLALGFELVTDAMFGTLGSTAPIKIILEALGSLRDN